MSLLVLFIAAVFVCSLVSGRLERTVVTAPIVFTVLGILAFPVIRLEPDGAKGGEVLLTLAELGLVLLLFTDASRTSLQVLKDIQNLPSRILSTGMLLTILLGALAVAPPLEGVAAAHRVHVDVLGPIDVEVLDFAADCEGSDPELDADAIGGIGAAVGLGSVDGARGDLCVPSDHAGLDEDVGDAQGQHAHGEGVEPIDIGLDGSKLVSPRLSSGGTEVDVAAFDGEEREDAITDK